MPLVRSGFVAIPAGPRPGFDHADVYRDGPGASRLYVAHTGADRVEVIDCAAGARVRALPGHPGVAGVLIDEDSELLFTSDRAAARVSVYRCPDEQFLARVRTGPHPNGLAFDPSRRQLFTFNLGQPPGHLHIAIGEPGVICVVDTDRLRLLETVPTEPGAHTLGIDPDRHAVYAFLPASSGAAVYLDQ